MGIEIREVGIEHAAAIGRLYSDHVDYQIQMDGYFQRNPGFNAEDYVRSMMNPKLSVFLAAFDGDLMVGFTRFGITFGGALMPLDRKVDRFEKGYLARFPRTLLLKIKALIESLVERLEKTRTGFLMMKPELIGYVGDTYISPEYRSRGIGKALFHKTEDWYRAHDVVNLELNYLDDNDKGRILFRSMGYKDRRILTRKKLD